MAQSALSSAWLVSIASSVSKPLQTQFPYTYQQTHRRMTHVPLHIPADTSPDDTAVVHSPTQCPALKLLSSLQAIYNLIPLLALKIHPHGVTQCSLHTCRSLLTPPPYPSNAVSPSVLCPPQSDHNLPSLKNLFRSRFL